MAQRIQNKRSSIAGKRPEGRYLSPGEIALNTNASDSGLYFETNDGSVAKVGPTFPGVSPPPPGEGYGNGETWLDTGNRTFNTYSSAVDEWIPSLSPFFGGSTTAIFVGTEFPEATDDLSNDGKARPFATINRACIEVARRSILRGRGDEVLNNRFSIMLLPGRNVVQNEPGMEVDTYIENETKFVENQTVTVEDLAKFNPITGGLPLPRGTSLFGLDLRKTVVVPTYYPAWDRERYLNNPETIAPRSSIIKWTGNGFITSLTAFDKVGEVSVTALSSDSDLNDVAILTSLFPHGFSSAREEVNISYPESIGQVYKGSQTISPSPSYWVEPIDSFRFYLRKDSSSGSYVSREELPEFPSTQTSPNEFLIVKFALSTHHRLSLVSACNETELNDYYAKVQHAFGNLDFGNTLNNAEVGLGETTIVGPVPTSPVPETDQVKNSSPYIYNVSVRSNYGMCGLTNDGNEVSGFKSALVCNFTVVSLQNDPEVLEVYLSTQNKKGWFSLRQAVSFSRSVSAGDVTNSEALKYLVDNVDLQNLRYFYRSANDVLVSNQPFSSGLPDEVSDTRHYGILGENGSFTQISGSFAIGPSVDFWAKNGGRLTLSGCSSNFGGQSLRSEGFSGIGTTGGALQPDRGFTVQGIKCPARLNRGDLVNARNHRQLFFNVGILSVDPVRNRIQLSGPIDVSIIYPYTLKAGTAIWVQDEFTGDIHYAILENFLATSSPISEDGTELQLSSVNDGITSLEDLSNLGLLFIRRFVDPRSPEDRTYYLWVQNTSQNHRPPQSSYVLRYDEKEQTTSGRLIYPGRQLDPGQSGGWNQTFSVAGALTKEDGDNPNISSGQNNPSRQSTGYYLALRLCDSFGPWIGGYVAPEGEEAPGIQQYAKGSFVTSESYNFYAINPEIQVGSGATDPSAQGFYRWSPSKPYEYSQPTSETFIPKDEFPASADPWTGTYGETDTYLRGVGVERDSYFSRVIVDEDDGSADLGLADNVSDEKISYSHSRLALARFLRLLGYPQSEVETLLVPRPLTQRSILVGGNLWPTLVTGDGNAETQGNWSLEFNQPSSILSTNHTWEWSGYFNYTKGLPQYQTSPLSTRLRFDYILSQTWGGQTVASGVNESSEFVLSGLSRVTGNGEIFSKLDEEENVTNDGPDDVFVLRSGDNMTGDLTLGEV